jgi:hypothetical protein
MIASYSYRVNYSLKQEMTEHVRDNLAETSEMERRFPACYYRVRARVTKSS